MDNFVRRFNLVIDISILKIELFFSKIWTHAKYFICGGLDVEFIPGTEQIIHSADGEWVVNFGSGREVHKRFSFFSKTAFINMVMIISVPEKFNGCFPRHLYGYGNVVSRAMSFHHTVTTLKEIKQIADDMLGS